MKKTVKLLLLLSCAALCLSLLAARSLAAPAAPTSGRVGAEAACRSHSGQLVTLDEIPAARRSLLSQKAFAPSLGHVKKNIPMVAIVVGLGNMPYSNDYDWNDRLFNDDKSITAYYSDMSFGKFTFLPAQETSACDGSYNTNTADRVNDGVVHVKLSKLHEDWATDYTQTKPKKTREQYLSLTKVFLAAIDKASEYVDFAAYDADGNGVIENTELAICFIVAGYEGSYLESYDAVGAEKVLWAHAYTLVDMIADYSFDLTPPTPGGVTVSDYITVAEELEPGLPQPISTLAHELGHYLGLPDLYDTDYSLNAQWSDYQINTVSIMCSGWGYDPETDGYVPFSMDPWCRYKLGWIDPVIAQSNGDYDVKGQSYTASDAYAVVLIPTQKSKEYYLAENRQLTKWDAGMTTSYEGASRIGGVILWHIDDAVFDKYNEYNAVNNAYHRPAIMPLFPEEVNGVVTFTGTGTVFSDNPFYDRTYAIERLELENAVIDLPVYGTGGLADQRTARWSSGITVEFLNDSAADMQLRVNRDNQKPLTDENECMYCHHVHDGFFGGIVAFFHRILYFIKTMFGR